MILDAATKIISAMTDIGLIDYIVAGVIVKNFLHTKIKKHSAITKNFQFNKPRNLPKNTHREIH